MSEIRSPYLVADRQSQLMREAAEERLARIARASRGGPVHEPYPGRGLARWSHRLAGLLASRHRHHGPWLHGRRFG